MSNSIFILSPETAQSEPQFPPEVIDDGIAVIEQFFRKWADETRDDGLDGDDIIMSDLSPENQLQELKKCFEEFKPQIDNNPWVQSLMSSL